MAPANAGNRRRGRPEHLRANRPQRRIIARQRIAQIKHRPRIAARQDDPGHAPIGRHPRRLAPGGLGAPEPVFVARQDGADHRMFGLEGLQQRHARPLGPPGPARHLAHQLERTFRRAQVRPLQAQIRINHPHQRQQRKIVPLGHQLRADDDVGPALGNLLDPRLQRPRTAKQIRAERGNAGLGKQRAGLLGQPLNPRPDRSQPPLGRARGAGIGERPCRAALMAHQAVLKPVLDHARVAMVTADLLTAGPAQRHRRIAAPVDEQQRLFALCQPRLDRAPQAGRDPRPRRHLLGPHINGPHVRQHRRAKPRGQLQPFVFARLRVGPAFQRRRGAGQHHPCATDRRAQNRHVAGIVQHPVLLLVGGVMFLIDHDQPQVAERQEQRRTRPHHQLRLALPQHPPHPAPFGHGHAGMPLGGPRAKPRLNPGQEFPGQGNLGQQHQRLTPQAQRLGHRLQINLGLARTGHPPEQRRAVFATALPLAQRCHRRALFRSQCLALARRVQRREWQIARAVRLDHRAMTDQPLDHRRRHPGHPGQFLQGEGQPAVFLQRRQHPAARLRHPLGQSLPQPIDLAHRRRIAQARRAGRQPQHRRHRRQRVFSGTGQKRAHFLAHRRCVQHPDHRAHPGQIEIAPPRSPDHPQHLARSQRHLDKRAAHAAAFGRAIIQRPVRRLRAQHRHQSALIKEIRTAQGAPLVVGVSA